MKLHDDKESAKEACEEYSKAIRDMQERFRVWEENELSCTFTFVYAKYVDETGKIVNYCHN